MAGVVRNLVARAGLDISDYEKNIKKMQKSLDKTAKKLNSIGKQMTKAITLPIMGIAAAGIKTASDLEEVQNVVDVAFKNSASVVNEWSKTTLKAYGLSELSAKRYASTIRAMTDSTGIAADTADKMSMKIAELTGDMASFYNLRTDDMFLKLQSALSGEIEPLRRLGINLSVANLEAFAMSKGIKKAYTEMSEAEKVTLRYEYILQATTNAQGDFSRTAGSTANQSRLMKEQFLQTSASLMQSFLPAITSIIASINSCLGWINNLDEGSQKFIMTILLLVAAVGPVLIMAAKLVTAIKVLLPVIEALKISQISLNMAFLASPITWVVLLVVGLVAAFVLLWKKCDGFRQFWINLWDGIVIVVKGAINGVIGFINGYLSVWKFMVNSTIDFINELIKGANKLPGINVPLIPELSAESLQIPYLAKGGIAYGDTLARVGEYAGASSNPEVIAPLDKLQGMLGETSRGDIIVINKLDGKVLSKSMIKYVPGMVILKGT